LPRRQEDGALQPPVPGPLEVGYAPCSSRCIENKEVWAASGEFDRLDELHVRLTHADPTADEVEDSVAAEQIVLKKGEMQGIW